MLSSSDSNPKSGRFWPSCMPFTFTPRGEAEGGVVEEELRGFDLSLVDCLAMMLVERKGQGI